LRKADRSLLLSALCAPFEKKDFVGLDLESKNNKKRAEGRLKKQLGDLSLQAGRPSEAITHYQAASEILKSVNDWLWLAGWWNIYWLIAEFSDQYNVRLSILLILGALEGMCSASVATMYPQLRRSPTLQRNSSLQGGEFARFKQFAMASTNSLPAGLDPAEVTEAKSAAKNCLSQVELLEKYREAVTHYGKVWFVIVIDI